MYPADALTIILSVFFKSLWLYSIICQLGTHHLLLAFLSCLVLTLISIIN